MAEFLTTPAGIALILVAQGLLMAIFLLLSAYFLIYADRKVWAAV
jgi:NADH-quinone oxidoreductase subunit H